MTHGTKEQHLAFVVERLRPDLSDAVASACALAEAGEMGWLVGNRHRLVQPDDTLFFKVGGARLQQR